MSSSFRLKRNEMELRSPLHFVALEMTSSAGCQNDIIAVKISDSMRWLAF